MIKETLRILFIGKCSFQEAAEKLGIDSVSLRDRLMMLKHMGYICETCDNPGPSTSTCCSCNTSSPCHKNIGSSEGKILQLTEKGEKICR
ncbi:MAG: hypothetical protein QCH31_03955 [Methanolobus sp.]|nr:hypothetical protein [Methanolobus sp.]